MGQCEDLENTIKAQYGDNYVEQAKASSESMSTLLTTIASNRCQTHFNYDTLVSDFCAKPENVFSSIGGGRTCKEFDTDGSKVGTWCLVDDRMRSRTDACNKTNLKSSYGSTAKSFCRQNPQESWCSCYNISNNICVSNMDAAGCKEIIGNLDSAKEFLKDGYDILKANAHCRPRVCNRPDRVFVPKGTLDDCKDSYRFCDKDIDIRTNTNSDIVLKCNKGMKASELPDWWDEGGDDDSWLTGDRSPPFDKFPLDQLPITEIPDEFDWEDDNVRYLTYGGAGSCVLCCCCIVVIMIVMSRLKKK